MDTKDMFQRLVADEPPLLLDVRQVVDHGRRARRGRYVGAVAAAVTIAVVVTGGVAATQGQHTRLPVGGATPSPSRITLPSVPSFRFDSAAQISASNAGVYGLLVSYAGGTSTLTKGYPTWDTAPIKDNTASVGAQVEYRVGSGTGMLRAVTGTAADARSRYGGLLAGDLCAALTGRSTDEGTFVECSHRALPGGGSLWTYARRESSPGQITDRAATSTLGPAVYERDAIVVAADGSALDLLFQVFGTQGGGPAPVPLTESMMPSLVSLGALALDAAGNWQSHVGEVAGLTKAAPLTSYSSASVRGPAHPTGRGPVRTTTPSSGRSSSRPSSTVLPPTGATASDTSPPSPTTTQTSAPSVSKRAPSQGQLPAAGVCSGLAPSGATVSLSVAYDLSVAPRCFLVRGDQRLEVVNDEAASVLVQLGFVSFSVPAHGHRIWSQPFSQYLAQGEHGAVISGGGVVGAKSGADIVVDPSCKWFPGRCVSS